MINYITRILSKSDELKSDEFKQSFDKSEPLEREIFHRDSTELSNRWKNRIVWAEFNRPTDTPTISRPREHGAAAIVYQLPANYARAATGDPD